MTHPASESDDDAATAWFEPLYARAAAGTGEVPWDAGEASPHLAALLGGFGAGGGAPAVVVGCGLGDDAALVASHGWATTAFDVSPTALRLAEERHPGRGIAFVAADLLDLPEQWRGAFALVAEHFTVQSLPIAVRERATEAVRSLLAPGGTLLVELLATEDASPDRPGPPWLFTARERDAFGAGLEHVRTDEHDEGGRWVLVYRRSGEG